MLLVWCGDPVHLQSSLGRNFLEIRTDQIQMKSPLDRPKSYFEPFHSLSETEVELEMFHYQPFTLSFQSCKNAESRYIRGFPFWNLSNLSN